MDGVTMAEDTRAKPSTYKRSKRRRQRDGSQAPPLRASMMASARAETAESSDLLSNP